jgi:uncharacterized membrane protein (UPF0136 family)
MPGPPSFDLPRSNSNHRGDGRGGSMPDEDAGELTLVSNPDFSPDQIDSDSGSDTRTESGADSPEFPRSSGAASGTRASEGLASATAAQANALRGQDQGDSSRRGLPIWLFVVAFLLFALALGWQFQVAGQLEQEIAGLETELAETTALLGAHQSRLLEIRGGVHELVAQLDGLRALVEAEPTMPPISPMPTEAVGRSRPASRPTSGDSRPEIPARLPQAAQ